ncbi:hypothetical protein RF11_00548 [Thelohanellus kitauei]|uniref:Uncharacterized protein n=1 Tax=Thelohanellus kitauei TaxID=669202 RepID=A0A0C2ND13_THEKT|nr:hypothetical protein RF11_00548 [Thelohanellus kitauei]
MPAVIRRSTTRFFDCKEQLEEYTDLICKNLETLCAFFSKKAENDRKVCKQQEKLHQDAENSFLNDDVLICEDSDISFCKSLKRFLTEHQIIINQYENMSQLSLRLSLDLKKQINIFNAEKNKVFSELTAVNQEARSQLEAHFQKKTAMCPKECLISPLLSKNKKVVTFSSMDITAKNEKLELLKKKKDGGRTKSNSTDEPPPEITSFLRNYINKTLPSKYNELEKINQKMIEDFKSNAIKYLKRYKNQICNIVNNSVDSMIQTVISISPQTENRIIVDSLFTGYLPSCDPETFRRQLKNSSRKPQSTSKKRSSASTNRQLRRLTINYDVVLSNVPPAKILSTIQHHIEYLYKEMNRIDKKC